VSASPITRVQRQQYISQYHENSCFRRVHCSLRRLEIWKQVIILEVFHKLRANESLKQLGNDGQVRDRPVGLSVGRIEICFLQQRRNVSRDMHVYSPCYAVYSISLCRLRLSRPGCLVPRQGGLSVQRRSPTWALTGPSIE